MSEFRLPDNYPHCEITIRVACYICGKVFTHTQQRNPGDIVFIPMPYEAEMEHGDHVDFPRYWDRLWNLVICKDHNLEITIGADRKPLPEFSRERLFPKPEVAP